MKELFIPAWIFVTASLCCIPFNLSLKTPVIEEAVCSIESITNWMACTAYTFTVSSNPLNSWFIGACPVLSWPSWEVSSKPIPYFL
jgi:hypothetical protein